MFETNTFTASVMRSCEPVSFTRDRQQLVQMARVHGSTLLLATGSCFNFNHKVFVTSELFDISLADLMDCTILIQEDHLSTIIYQASQFFRSQNIMTN